jgi:hypothetical protein
VGPTLYLSPDLLQGGASDRSAQELQNGFKKEAHAKFLTEIWAGKILMEII